MADGWDLFGPDDGTAVVAPIIPVKRSREDERDATVAALAPFANADGSQLLVPPPPALAACSDVSAATTVWPDHPPLIVGPIAVRTYDDCGRGFVATRDINPGEVLMVEAPFVSWETEERGPLPLLRTVLQRGNSATLLSALSSLHPETLDVVPTSEQSRLAEDCGEIIDALLPLWTRAMSQPASDGCGKADARGETSGHGEIEARRALLRLCLAVRWNAFDSGLFLHQAIFNHAPARLANADKAAVPRASVPRAGVRRASGGGGMSAGGASSAGDADASSSSPGGVLSIVRATRCIACGEQCLISYLQPPELSLAASGERLLQFDFGCGSVPRHAEWDRAPRSSSAAASNGGLTNGGLTNGGLASGSADADALTLSLEEEAQRSIRSAMRQQHSLREGLSSASSAIAALADELGSHHLGVACARRQLITALRKRLQASAEGDGSAGGAAGQEATTAALLVLLENALELWTTQRALLGPIHPEVAQTMHDIGTSISALLSTAPKALTERFAALWPTPALASHAHRRALELYEAIAALYDLRCLELTQ